MPQKITLIRPDDWHLHVRDGAALKDVVPHTARQFGRAIIMPNLAPPVTTLAQVEAYRERILAAIPAGSSFEPLMTLYLTDKTPSEDIGRAKESGLVFGAKLYPAGATTHSAAGVTDIANIHGVLEAMEKHNLPLLVHGEVTDSTVDVFDRESVFIERHLEPLTKHFPGLRVVLEHITTEQGIHFVEDSTAQIGGTITAHHLLLNRNAMFKGGMNPHHYCLPVLKREHHRKALVKAATSGNEKFFLGTDSAPHPLGSKQSACGCAGIYSAPAAMELYAEAFEHANALDKLEAFASFHGADFYGLPRNSETITLTKTDWQAPADYPLGSETVIPLRAGETLHWKFSNE